MLQLFGQAEIENLRVAASGDEDIRGLDIAMDDSSGVSGIERVGDFDAQFEQRLELERLATDAVLQSCAIEIFHGDEVAAFVAADFVDRADIRMIQSGGRARFALKSLERVRIARGFFRQEFQRDEAAERGVLGFVHHAHPAAAELLDDAVMRHGAADEWLGVGHKPRILGWLPSRVNVASSSVAAK